MRGDSSWTVGTGFWERESWRPYSGQSWTSIALQTSRLMVFLSVAGRPSATVPAIPVGFFVLCVEGWSSATPPLKGTLRVSVSVAPCVTGGCELLSPGCA